MTTQKPNRTCGNCRACCIALKVDDVPKEEWQRCVHLGNLGCKIYSKRPDSCRAFACGWLQGMGGKTDRPDRLGVIITPVSSTDLGDHAIVHEVIPGSMQKPRVRALLGELIKHTIAFEIRRDSMRKLIGAPPHLLRPLMEKAQRAGVLTINGERPPPDVPIDQVLANIRSRNAG